MNMFLIFVIVLVFIVTIGFSGVVLLMLIVEAFPESKIALYLEDDESN